MRVHIPSPHYSNAANKQSKCINCSSDGRTATTLYSTSTKYNHNIDSSSIFDPILQHPATQALSVEIRPRSRLKRSHEHLFTSSNSNSNSNNANASTTRLFDELGLVACSTGVVCRKEFLETYTAAACIHAKFPHCKRMADLAAGHGLLSWFLLALDNDDNTDVTPKTINHDDVQPAPAPRTVVCVDCRMPPSADAIAAAMIGRYPALEDRWSYVQSDLSAIVPHPSCLLVSVHACGTLSDGLIETSIGAGAPLALVPCCHTVKAHKGYRPHYLSGMDVEEVVALVEERKKKEVREKKNANKHDVVVDVVNEVRFRTLENAGYAVEEVMLPEAFTARNRLLLAEQQIMPTATSNADGNRVEIVNDMNRPFFESQAANNGEPLHHPPSTIRIPLEDNPESIAQCHAVSGRGRAATRMVEQIPRHFSLSIAISIWLTDEENDSSSSEDKNNNNNLDLTKERLQDVADQIIGSQGTVEAQDIQCTVETFGEVNVQSTTGRCSQLYKFRYTKSDGSSISDRRAVAKTIHSMIRENVIGIFGDLVR